MPDIIKLSFIHLENTFIKSYLVLDLPLITEGEGTNSSHSVKLDKKQSIGIY